MLVVASGFLPPLSAVLVVLKRACTALQLYVLCAVCETARLPCRGAPAQPQPVALQPLMAAVVHASSRHFRLLVTWLQQHLPQLILAAAVN